MSLAIDRGLKEEVKRKLAELERSLEGRAASAAFPMVAEVNREIADAIEEWTKIKLDELVRGERNIQSLSEALAKIHRSLSGASRIGVRADVRSITLDVEGCATFRDCRLKAAPGRHLGCLPDMIVAAILQRVMDTPVRIEVARDARVCTKKFTPAWLVDLLAGLDPFGAEGLVVVYKDRVMFSHVPSEAEAEVLSESLLADEERLGAGESRLSEFGRQGKKILLTRLGDIFVSVCLRPDAPEGEVQQRVLKAIQRAVEAL